jgi:hypothetical protein
MEEALKYLSQIALSGAAFSFVIGLIKWIDQRKRDQEEKQYQSFHKMVVSPLARMNLEERLRWLSKLPRFINFNAISNTRLLPFQCSNFCCTNRGKRKGRDLSI